MGCSNKDQVVSHAGSKDMMESEHKESPFASIPKSPIQSSRPSSMVVKKAHTVIPAHIVAEAISTLHGLDLRWSGPITNTERVYVEQYVLAKYPQYAGQVEIENMDLSSLCINEESSEPAPDDKRKSPKSNFRESSTPSFGSNLPDLDRIQLEASRLLDILTKKSSFPGSFISIPEIQARNKVLRHCGLQDDDYLVLFTPNYKDAMMLVGESYPFFRGNFYMTIIGEEMDYIREFAIYKEAKAILAPESWLDLRIKGSQLSQYFRRKCKHSPKGLFSYPADVNGMRYSMHWISEAHRNSWHVLLDATALVVGQDRLNLALHRPDFVLCSLENTHAQPSRITCLLVRKKSFDTTTSSSQVTE
ncbi:Pyridoxal phosphate-dependent transferases superfamily protein [Theobroma cacao]|uniref:Pyridoxal phosphate-dependent transferases superfamily protein n=1 Tax=Theobroma cacao TaxID=3641 RepID=A0A061FY65_THECC|nr:Pyridoxal phosphate-dependent transferases superfamily protein [Theobroma cacao]